MLSETSRPVLRLAAPVVRADHSRGPADAPVTLVEYADFDCPDFARAHPVVEEVLEGAGGTVRFVFRHFPIIANHPNSMNAAEAAEAASRRAARNCSGGCTTGSTAGATSSASTT